MSILEKKRYNVEPTIFTHNTGYRVIFMEVESSMVLPTIYGVYGDIIRYEEISSDVCSFQWHITSQLWGLTNYLMNKPTMSSNV